MKPVARWTSKGIYKGVTQKLREMPGEHLWLVRFERVLPPDPTLPPDDKNHGKDRVDHRDVVNDKPIPLGLLGPFAEQAMQDLFADGETTVKQITWTAFVRKP